MSLLLLVLLLISCVNSFTLKVANGKPSISANPPSSSAILTKTELNYGIHSYQNEKTSIFHQMPFYGLSKPHVRLPEVCPSEWDNLILSIRERDIRGGIGKVSIGIYRTNEELPVMRVDRFNVVDNVENQSPITVSLFPGKVNKSLIIAIDGEDVAIKSQDGSLSQPKDSSKTTVHLGTKLIMMMDYTSGVSLKLCATLAISLLQGNPQASPRMIVESLEEQKEACQSTLMVFTQITNSQMNEDVISDSKNKKDTDCIII